MKIRDIAFMQRDTIRALSRDQIASALADAATQRMEIASLELLLTDELDRREELVAA